MTQPVPFGEAQRYFREVVLAHDGAECLIWPYARDERGYAKMFCDGRNSRVSRLVCRHVNGAPPTPKHHAAHSCGKGSAGCVAKRHMSWKTPLENEADKVLHGTTNRGERCGSAKLSEADIRAIRALKGTMKHADIASRFRVDPSHITMIIKGKAWRYVA